MRSDLDLYVGPPAAGMGGELRKRGRVGIGGAQGARVVALESQLVPWTSSASAGPEERRLSRSGAVLLGPLGTQAQAKAAAAGT